MLYFALKINNKGTPSIVDKYYVFVYNRCAKGIPFNPFKPTLRVLNMTINEKKNVKITFRLSESEFKPYEKVIAKSGLKTSQVMREVFIEKSDKVVLPKQQSSDSKRLVFLANKASNNINQIAKKLNIDHLEGTVNEKTYTALLNNLINIERSFFNAIKKC